MRYFPLLIVGLVLYSCSKKSKEISYDEVKQIKTEEFLIEMQAVQEDSIYIDTIQASIGKGYFLNKLETKLKDYHNKTTYRYFDIVVNSDFESSNINLHEFRYNHSLEQIDKNENRSLVITEIIPLKTSKKTEFVALVVQTEDEFKSYDYYSTDCGWLFGIFITNFQTTRVKRIDSKNILCEEIINLLDSQI